MLSGVTSESSRDQYLQLLIAQLRNQDPISPVQQEDFIAQLAQFATLEGVENLNDTLQAFTQSQQVADGAHLLDRVVAYESDGLSGVGTVQGVEVQEGKLALNVQGEYVPIEFVTGVYA